jgi:pyruvate ferredoxin oxidoreductase beta subunit
MHVFLIRANLECRMPEFTMSQLIEGNPLTLKSLTHKERLLAAGHRLCSGCGAPTIVHQVLLAINEPVVLSNASSCLEVSTRLFSSTA